MKHTISVLVENEFGALARIAGLFSGRGYNIQSLSVAETIDPHVSRMTITTVGGDEMITQILKQLNKLVNVVEAKNLTDQNPINRSLALIKVKSDKKTRADILKLAEKIKADIADLSPGVLTLEVRGSQDDIQSALNFFKKSEILEFVQTGNISILRG